MDEESLEAALQTYHAQLRLVERALDAGAGAGPDAGLGPGPSPDAGPDAGLGPSPDAGPDAGLGLGPSPDAGPDAGLGPSPDAGPGAGLGLGPDAGPDAGLGPGPSPDAGPGAGLGLGPSPDAGPGAGPDAAAEADLRQLQGDLKELIALTEASLVSVRKSKLLAALEPEPAARDEAEYLAFQKAIAEAAEAPAAPGADLEAVPEGEARPEPTTPGREEGEDRDPEEELSGAKVNAPYYSAWGTLEYHNAMVVGTEEAEDGTGCVRVLYLYPTHKSLKPCPFFLEGKCRFKENCRFSHGQVVSVDELRPFQDPDLSLLQVGSACLAKHQDGLWHPARITDVDSGYYTVKFDSLLLKEAVVEGDSILPPLRTEGPESSDSDSGDTDDSSYARVVESTVDPGTCSSAFAGWEVHTRGIGSKLLAKMGYELGKGLGRRAEGRVEPIHAVVLPRGKSLDQCAEILQKRTKRAQASASRPPRCRGSRGGPRGRQPRSVFDFLNEKLQSQAPGVLEAGVDPPGRKNKDMYHATKSTKQALSLQLFQTEEKIQQTRRDIGSIQEALSRNAGRHGLATAQLQERLEGAQRQLGQLRAQEAGLQLQRRKADTHRKMTEF